MAKGMDGDSSTTDASQLGIAGEYIGGSHFVIQPHDDTEDSMNDHEDTNGSKESFREQDIYLPIANVARIMKNAIPQTGKAMKGEKGIGGTVTTADGLSEELTEEAFTNQLPAGLITTDGQQQNVMVYTTSYQQISGVQQIQFS
ncbi:nuclear transcription factor Y subunit beta isoform X3 [Natator depressus]|uniref:nuclear transcription factor Y subunit beta isoform X3 n=1 Tax=Natator depressus TaxID=27790 RepID=UPI003EBEBEAD